MKNALFATTALVALGFAGTAFAAEPLTASVGGYMNVGLGFADNAAGDDIGIMRDGEIHFKFKGSSDNGLTFDGRVEIEAFGSSDQIDENWARVSGSFGWVMFGGNDTAMNELSAGVFYGAGAMMGYYDAFTSDLGKSYGTDAMGVHYRTPNFNGFQAGVTYIPESTSDNVSDSYIKFNDSSDGDNIWSVGANYSGDLGGVSISSSVGYSDADGADRDVWSAGIEAGMAGITLAAHYEDNAGSNTGQDLALGVSYSTGPWTATAGMATLLDAPAGGDVNTYAGWVTYKMAPGVSGIVGLEYHDTDASGSSTSGFAYLSLGF